MAQANQYRRVVNKSKGDVLEELKIFSNDEFGSVRTIQLENEIYFVGKDVAIALGYNNPAKALQDHVEPEDKLNNKSLSSLGQRGGWIINESGLYDLIFSSKLKSAKSFKRWVTKEVLPQIRRTGGYIPIYKEETVEEMTLRLINILQETIKEQKGEIEESKILLEEKDKKIEAQGHFVDYARKVTKSDKTRSFQEIAKTLSSDGINLGRTNLLKFLRREKILMKNNVPYQKYMNMGLFEVKYNFTTPNGVQKPTTYVTAKGEIYIAKRLADVDYWKEWIKKK